MGYNPEIDFVKHYEKIAANLAAATDLRALVATVEELSKEIVNPDYLAFYIFDPKTSSLRLVYSRGIGAKIKFENDSNYFENGPDKARKENIIVRFQGDERIKITFPDGSSILQNRIIFPVIRNEESIGALCLGFSNEDVYDTIRISLLSFMTNLAGVVYKNIIDRRELFKANRLLQQVNKSFINQKMQSIGQLAAGIAHELNTPLQYMGDNIAFLNGSFEIVTIFVDAVNSLMEIADKTNPDDFIKMYKKTIAETDILYFLTEIPPAICQSLEGLEKVSKIIKTLKDFAYPNSGEKSYHNVNKGIEDTLLISRNFWKNWANVDIKFAEGMPSIFCAADEINQAILQLILNSVDAIIEKITLFPEFRRGQINIETSYEENKIFVHFNDNGIGIPDNILHKIYDPFFTTKLAKKGSGQGLTLAHNIICTKHGGELIVRSMPNEGTSFIITLPITN